MIIQTILGFINLKKKKKASLVDQLRKYNSYNFID